MRSQTRVLVLVATTVVLAAFTGCTTTPETPDEAPTTATDPTAEEDAQEKKKAQRKNLGPLERELARLEDEAHAKLFSKESSCKMPELGECKKAESRELWLPAGMCYRDQIDLSQSDACRPSQLIKAAANFERGGERDIAVETRMKIIRDAGPNAAILTVDTADWLAEHGRVGRARFFYRIYLSQEPDGPLTDYVKGKCAELGGSCSVQQKSPRGGPGAPGSGQ